MPRKARIDAPGALIPANKNEIKFWFIRVSGVVGILSDGESYPDSFFLPVFF